MCVYGMSKSNCLFCTRDLYIKKTYYSLREYLETKYITIAGCSDAHQVRKTTTGVSRENNEREMTIVGCHPQLEHYLKPLKN